MSEYKLLYTINPIKDGMLEEKDEREDDEKDKGFGEKQGMDPFLAFFFGLMVILVGVFLLMAVQGIIEWEDLWSYLLLGIGCVLIIDALARCASQAHRRPIFGKVFWGLILIFIGGSGIYGVEGWWPLIIIVMGILIIFRGIGRARRPR